MNIQSSQAHPLGPADEDRSSPALDAHFERQLRVDVDKFGSTIFSKGDHDDSSFDGLDEERSPFHRSQPRPFRPPTSTTPNASGDGVTDSKDAADSESESDPGSPGFMGRWRANMKKFGDGSRQFLFGKEKDDALRQVEALMSYMIRDVHASKFDIAVGLCFLTANKPTPMQRSHDLITDKEILGDVYRGWKFAASAYGWKLLNGLVIKGRGIKYLPQTKCKELNRKAMVEYTGINYEDILHTKWQSSWNSPGHVVCYDRLTESIVVSIRGTMNITDALIDLMGHHEFYLDGHAHAGMLECAKEKMKVIKPQIAGALADRPTYRILIVGHSLGAGVAALFTLLLLNECPEYREKTHCYGFAPPCSVSCDIAVSEAAKAYITSIVYNDDIVSRLSLGSGALIRNELEVVLSQDHTKAQRLFQSLSVTDSIGTGAKKRFASWLKCEAAPDHNEILKLRREVSPMHKLYPPGEVMYIQTFNPPLTNPPTPYRYEIEYSNPSLFGEIVLSSRTVRDHLPWNLDEALLSILKDIGYVEPQDMQLVIIDDPHSVPSNPRISWRESKRTHLPMVPTSLPSLLTPLPYPVFSSSKKKKPEKRQAAPPLPTHAPMDPAAFAIMFERDGDEENDTRNALFGDDDDSDDVHPTPKVVIPPSQNPSSEVDPRIAMMNATASFYTAASVSPQQQQKQRLSLVLESEHQKAGEEQQQRNRLSQLLEQHEQQQLKHQLEQQEQQQQQQQRQEEQQQRLSQVLEGVHQKAGEQQQQRNRLSQLLEQQQQQQQQQEQEQEQEHQEQQQEAPQQRQEEQQRRLSQVLEVVHQKAGEEQQQRNRLSQLLEQQQQEQQQQQQQEQQQEQQQQPGTSIWETTTTTTSVLRIESVAEETDDSQTPSLFSTVMASSEDADCEVFSSYPSLPPSSCL